MDGEFKELGGLVFVFLQQSSDYFAPSSLRLCSDDFLFLLNCKFNFGSSPLLLRETGLQKRFLHRLYLYSHFEAGS